MGVTNDGPNIAKITNGIFYITSQVPPDILNIYFLQKKLAGSKKQDFSPEFIILKEIYCTLCIHLVKVHQKFRFSLFLINFDG
jgi:hypothetical protein